jgi:hypothetical protein
MTLGFYGQIPEYLKTETALFGVTARMRACVNNFETGTFIKDSNDFSFYVFILFI